MITIFLNILVCVLDIPIFYYTNKIKLKEGKDSLRILSTRSLQRGVWFRESGHSEVVDTV